MALKQETVCYLWNEQEGHGWNRKQGGEQPIKSEREHDQAVFKHGWTALRHPREGGVVSTEEKQKRFSGSSTSKGDKGLGVF